MLHGGGRNTERVKYSGVECASLKEPWNREYRNVFIFANEYRASTASELDD